jgi:triacylglycerol lipase
MHLVAPELREGLDAFPQFGMNAEFLAMARGVGSDMMPQPELSPEQQSVRREELFVPGPEGAPDVRVLLYTPPGEKTGRPAYLHIHGGGYVLGSPEMNDAANRTTALELDCVVAAVTYRLAPETQAPGPVEDCYAALLWLKQEAERLGIDPQRIAIGGESAGGGHAAMLAFLARDRGEVSVRVQILDSPMLDDRTGSSPDPHPYCGEFMWTPDSNRFGWSSLLGTEAGGADVPADAVPARRQDLAGLPPTYIAVGALDLFVEESLEYGRRLIRAGVPTEIHVIPGAYHGFSVTSPDAPQLQLHLQNQRDALARAFASEV